MNKKLKKIKYLFLIFFIFCFLGIFDKSNILKAVNLEFIAGKDIEGGVVIRVFSKAYQGSIDFFDSQGYSRGKFTDVDKENEYVKKYGYRYSEGDNVIYVNDYNYVGTSLNYSSAGIQFQKDGKMTSNYSSGGTKISYALLREAFEVEEIAADTDVNLDSYTRKNSNKYDISVNTNLTSQDVKRYSVKNDENSFRMLRWTILNNGTSVSDWFIPDSYIEEIDEAGYIEDGKVRFSLYTSVLANCYAQYCDKGIYVNSSSCDDSSQQKSQIDLLIENADEYAEQLNINDVDNFKNALLTIKNNSNSLLETAFMSILRQIFSIKGIELPEVPVDEDCICSNTDPLKNKNANIRKIAYTAKEAYDITVYGSGVMFNTSDSGLRGIKDSNKSLANDYDNWLILESVVKNIQKNVYIRHVDQNGNLLNIANAKEVMKTNGTSKLVSPTLTNVKRGKYTYQEAFENLKVEDELISSRSTTLVKDGITYTYTGAKIGKGSDITTAQSNMEKCPEKKIEKVSSGTTEHEYIVITYYYTKTDNPEDVPKLYFDNGSSSGSADGCETTYVSTGDKVKPYIVAPTYTIKNLIYTITLNNAGNISYELKDFVVKSLNSMSIVNSQGYDYKGENISGKIITSSNEREALFSGSSDKINLKYNSNIDTILKNVTNNIKTESNLSTVNVSSIKGGKTNKNNFTEEYTILENAYNGLRYVKGEVKYKDYDALKGKYGSTIDTKDADNLHFINVGNNITVSVGKVESGEVVNHTTQSGFAIQKNVEFSIKLNSKNQKYLDKYFLIFDFDINYNGKQYAKNTWIEIDANNNDNTVFKATPTSGTDSYDTIGQVENHMIVVGMSNNVPNNYKNEVFKQFNSDVLNKIYNGTTSSIKLENMNASSNKLTRNDVCDNKEKIVVNNNSNFTNKVDLYEDIYYFAWTKTTFKTLSRIYDFKVTDCLDVNYKSVFRKNESENVNDLTGTQYFSGTKELKIYGSTYNTLEIRKSSETILPLGPYKHTDTSYIFAPKLGYRISFDLKTSGYFDYNSGKSSRKILIKPTYYYISKDGKTLKENVNIYYKNSEGKYIKFVDSGYSIYFTPNDGYRYINNLSTTADTKNMSTKLTKIEISKSGGFEITSNMMATSDTNFIQSWYGEFKLPNSSIAVEGTDVNKPLTNGYIGVKFEIICIDEDSTGKEVRISYNVNNKSNNKPNTTQWDYEGYLGFNNPGSNLTQVLKLQLEKGTWEIDNDEYQKIKSTVILYDADSRAADDFE